MKLKIVKKEPKPFTGDDGEDLAWFWYRAEKDNGFLVRFGSNQDHEIGQTVEIHLSEEISANNKKWLKEITL